MTRAQLIVEKNKRRAEVRSKVKCAAVIALCIVIGAIPFGMRLHDIIAEEQQEEIPDDTYIKVYFETDR